MEADCYNYKMPQGSLRATSKQKPLVDSTQEERRIPARHHGKPSIHKKGAAQGKGATKQGGNNSQDGVPAPYLSAITLNGNGSKYSTERHSAASCVDQQDPVISAAYQTPVLVGMEVGAASVENSVGVPPRITSRNTIQPSSCIAEDLSEENETLI